jgi:predicted DNA-binding transcriptional regulator AlpA
MAQQPYSNGTVGEEVRELIDVDEMAARLKVRRSWLYRKTMLKGPGTIPRIRLGKYLRFDPAAVFRWVNETYGNESGELDGCGPPPAVKAGPRRSAASARSEITEMLDSFRPRASGQKRQ